VAVAFQPGNLVRRAGAEPNTETLPTLGATTVGDQFPHVATVAATLTHTPYADNQGHESKLIPTKSQPSGVRRLTPRETERLQGWPDDHTMFRRPVVLEGNRWVPEGESREQADGSRYKQVGNGIAAPCAAWVARRIAKKMMEE
jgi:DNA (cytosine-5)-methyltransferase 1